MSYPRETVEFLPVTVLIDGAPTTNPILFSVTRNGVRPLVWVDPVNLYDTVGVMVQGLDLGTYKVWAKITATPEIPVVDCGDFQVV